MDYFDDIRFVLADSVTRTRLKRELVPSYFGVQYIRRGGFYLRVDRGNAVTARGPAVFLTAPDRFFEYGGAGEGGRDHYWVCFQGERCARYRRGGLFREGVVTPVDDAVFFPVLSRLMELTARADHPRAVLALEQLLVMLREETPCGGRRSDPMTLLAERIAETPEADWDFAREAEKLHISENYFNRLFRQCLDTSPKQYLIHCRLRKAAHLLSSTPLPVREVAQTAGFADEHYFSRLFRMHYAIPPRRYREEFTR